MLNRLSIKSYRILGLLIGKTTVRTEAKFQTRNLHSMTKLSGFGISTQLNVVMSALDIHIYLIEVFPCHSLIIIPHQLGMFPSWCIHFLTRTLEGVIAYLMSERMYFITKDSFELNQLVFNITGTEESTLSVINLSPATKE